MASYVVSFRFDDEELDLLKIFSEGDESLNQTAARIVREAIGASLKQEEKQDSKKRLQDEIESRVDERLSYVVDNVNNIVNERIQELQKQIDEMKKALSVPAEKAPSKRSKTSASTVKKSTKANNEVVE